MTIGAKILAFAAILCIVVWVTFVAIGAQPLAESAVLKVIYGEGEEFYADAAIYHKLRNDTLYFLYLPHARLPYRWWSVDFKNMAIIAGEAPRSLGSRKYLLRGDRGGVKIDDKQKMGDWYWHFTESGAAFSGNGFTCSVRKTKNK